MGVLSFGTAAVGLLAVGCMAVGVKACAWLSALGWDTAQSGGFAIAGHAAEGPVSLARHAIDAVARQLLADPSAGQTQTVLLVAITILPLVPIALYAHAVRRRLGGRAGPGEAPPH
ncbi:MAG: hypothetical protein J0L84_02420 [Verrucomicrobia bacterium]|nr:hypothetical protein [Verrucomicrobiota bacterium]